MSIPKWLQIGHDQVFSLGAFLVSEVTPMIDFDKSSGENRVQARDRDTGLPMWQVEVLDGDPAAPKRSRTVTVKFASPTQPSTPANSSGTPFTQSFSTVSWRCHTSRSPATSPGSPGRFEPPT